MRPDPKKVRVKLYKCKVCKKDYSKGSNPTLDFIGVCTFDCATSLAKTKLEKKRLEDTKQERKDWLERKKVLKSELTVGKQSQNPLQVAINKLVRLLDQDYPCIARPNEQNQHFDAGHIYSVGSYPALRYYLWNIHKQSVKSNRDLGGESTLMLDGLLQRYGQEVVDKLEEKRRTLGKLGLSVEEEAEALARVRELIRRVERGETLTRDFCNTYISIY